MVKIRSSKLLTKIIPVLACPQCKVPLGNIDSQILLCQKDPQHHYHKNEWGFYEFTSKKIPDKYDSSSLVRQYIGYSFGYKLVNVSKGGRFIGTGQSEGLYRCVSDLILREILYKRLYCNRDVVCLDMACGVGRCVADLASALPEALIVGFDYSSMMIKQILA